MFGRLRRITEKEAVRGQVFEPMARPRRIRVPSRIALRATIEAVPAVYGLVGGRVGTRNERTITFVKEKLVRKSITSRTFQGYGRTIRSA